MKYFIILLLLIALVGCKDLEENTRRSEIQNLQEKEYESLEAGAKFVLEDYSLLDLEVSYSDTNVIQYRYEDWSWYYKVTVNREDSIITMTRSYFTK